MRITLTIISLLIATQSYALSCMRPDIFGSFKQYNDAKETYILAYGTFSREGELPKNPTEGLMPHGVNGVYEFPKSSTEAYHFDGVLIGTESDTPCQKDIQVTVDCVAHWCGSWPNINKKALAYIKVSQENGNAVYSLNMGACNNSYFTNISEKDISQLRGCFVGNCPSPERY